MKLNRNKLKSIILILNIITISISLAIQYNVLAVEKEDIQVNSMDTLKTTVDNYVYINSFEEDVDEWYGRNAQISTEASAAYSGSSSLKVKERLGTWSGPQKDFTNILEKGKSYYFSTYIMFNDENGLDEQTFNFSFENIIDKEAVCTIISSKSVKKGEWTKVDGYYKIPNKNDLSKYSFYIELPYKELAEDSDKIDFYIDDVFVAEVKEKTFQEDIPQLKNVFEEYFPLGTAVNANEIDSDDIHSEFIKHQYNAIVADNCMKPDALQPTEGNFNWTEGDKIANYARKNDMIMRGHTLVWHSQVSDWFFEDLDDSSRDATSELLLERMKTHIQTIIRHYDDDVDYWDVVNEVLSDSDGIRREAENSKWASIVGDVDEDGNDTDFIELAFKYAKEVNPKGKLIINDYGLEASDRKTNAMYDMIKIMLEKDIPIDGIGLQMHISVSNPSAEDIKRRIEKLASLKEFKKDGDFIIQITEMDMSVFNSNEENEITEKRLEEQAKRYKDIFEVYKEEAEKGNVNLVMMWGNSDDNTWLDNTPVLGREDAPLLFDRLLQAKPAFYSITDFYDEEFEKPVKGVILEKETLSIIVGNSEKLIATVVPNDAENKNVKWKSSNENVAKVDIDGNITTLTEGKAIITVTTEDGNYKAECEITVIKDIQDVHTFTYTAGKGGTIIGQLYQTVNYGELGSEVSAIADSGYKFLKWSDGTINLSRIDTNIGADIDVAAIFENDLVEVIVAGIKLNGDTKVGNTLSVEFTDINGSIINVSENVSYKWYRSINSDFSDSYLIGNDGRYKLVSNDAGKYIKLIVTVDDKIFETVTSKISNKSSSGSSSSTPNIDYTKNDTNDWNKEDTINSNTQQEVTITGWKQVNNEWYYLNIDGSMATGWKQVNNEWYYLNTNGEMECDTIVDGYKLDTSGALC